MKRDQLGAIREGRGFCSHAMFGRAGALGIFVLGILASAACSSGSDTDADRKYTSELARALCDAHARCCIGAPACELRMRVERYDRGAVIYDAQAGAECLENIARAYKDCALDAQEMDDVYTTCSRAMSGRREAGEACTSSVECANDGRYESECERTDSNNLDSPFVCRSVSNYQISAGRPGESCRYNCDGRPKEVGPWVNCVSNDVKSGSVGCFASDGLQCAGAPANPTCTPLPAAGEACVSTCHGGLYCNEATLLCEPKLSEGAECRHHYECQDNFCSPAFGCGTVSVGDSMLCLRVIESIFDAVLYWPL